MLKEGWIKEAIERKDADTILDTGAELYRLEKYDEAIEYYRLAASMGNKQAICNLGYCYLYGRGTQKNEELAYNYFKISADECIDSLYKLGSMFETGIVVEKSKETANYYYHLATIKIRNSDISAEEYPAIYYRLAKNMMDKNSNELYTIYMYLIIARDGYENKIENGEKYYQKSLEEVEKLLKDERLGEFQEDDEF